jgi:hypothetical protein
VKLVGTQDQYGTVQRIDEVPETGNKVYWVKTRKGEVKCFFRDEIEPTRWPAPITDQPTAA